MATPGFRSKWYQVGFLALSVVASQVWTVQTGDVKYGQVCSSTSECVNNQGLVCLKPFSSCSKGICACPDSKAYVSSDSVCKTKRYIGDSCGETTDIVSVVNGICSDNQVKCQSAGSTAAGKALCKSTTYPVLGEACIITCHYYTDTTVSYALCSDGRCICPSGKKKSGTNCVDKALGDSCNSTDSTDGCPNGQSCVESKCACASDYTSYQSGCSLKGSVTKGNTCKVGSSDSSKRCLPGLYCGNCPDDVTGVDPKCLSIGNSENAVCSGDSPCSYEYECIEDPGTGTGKICYAAKREGDGCSTSDPCRSAYSCVESRCITLGSSGATCTSHATCQAGLDCKTDPKNPGQEICTDSSGLNLLPTVLNLLLITFVGHLGGKLI